MSNSLEGGLFGVFNKDPNKIIDNINKQITQLKSMAASIKNDVSIVTDPKKFYGLSNAADIRKIQKHYTATKNELQKLMKSYPDKKNEIQSVITVFDNTIKYLDQIFIYLVDVLSSGGYEVKVDKDNLITETHKRIKEIEELREITYISSKSSTAQPTIPPITKPTSTITTTPSHIISAPVTSVTVQQSVLATNKSFNKLRYDELSKRLVTDKDHLKQLSASSKEYQNLQTEIQSIEKWMSNYAKDM